MVNTRAQALQNSLPREDEIDNFNDNASDLSLPEIGTHTFEIEIKWSRLRRSGERS